MTNEWINNKIAGASLEPDISVLLSALDDAGRQILSGSNALCVLTFFRFADGFVPF